MGKECAKRILFHVEELISLHVECGNEGKWNVLFSKINKVGLVAVKPSGENKTRSFKTVLTNGRGPRPNAAWKPKAQAGPQKAVFHKSNMQHISTKPILTKSGETQPSVSVSKGAVIRLPGVASSRLQHCCLVRCGLISAECLWLSRSGDQVFASRL